VSSKQLTLILSLVVALALVLTGCAAPPTTPSGEEAAPADVEEAAAEGGKLEVLHWWTSGGEADAMQSLFDAFSAAYPDVEIIDAAIAGGGGSNARPVLQTRLAGGDPPDTWQAHPGFELIGQYVDPGFTEPVNDVYEEEGFYDVMPQALIDMQTVDGNVYEVTVGVHRGNGFWYNEKLLAENGIDIGESLSVDEFITIADQLLAAGVTPLCVGDVDIWTTAQLFENTLLGTIGPEAYSGLWDGSTSFADEGVKQAMATYGQMLDYQNEDHAALDWSQAVAALMEGRCAFNSMGDWAYGEFVSAGQVDNEDFGWVSHPGSDGSFMLVADGFPIGKDAANPEQAKDWLRVIGSKEAQEAFNPLKGSICARTDCDREKFGVYHNWAMDSFANDAIVPTVVHGSAAPADFQQALNEAVTSFVVDRNVDAFSDALVSAAQASGFGQ
jgi:glucose/mannose transport system substrate-binding protein